MVNTGKPTSSKKKAGTSVSVVSKSSKSSSATSASSSATTKSTASSNITGNSGSSSKNGAAPIKIRIPPPKKQTTSSTTPSVTLASSSNNISTAVSANAKSKVPAPTGPSSAVPHAVGENVKHETEESEEEIAEPPREEHFILRISGLPQESQEKFREQARKRLLFDDLSILFKDPRHAIFSYDKEKYSARLVDLPCIIESQKTLNNKQFYKIADVSQMLVVESPISDESELKASMQWDEFLWPDGLSPPLKNVRKRRFRKRFSNRNIEEIDNEVERLLTLAKAATSISYELTEIEDSEVETPGPDGEDRMDGEFEGLEIGDEIDSDGEEAGAALQRELEMMDVEDERTVASDNEEEEEDDESDEDSDDSSESEEETEEDLEQKRKELEDQITTNESAIQGKHNQLANTVNTIIKKRFEETIEKLTADIELKKIQLDEVKRKLEAKRASTSISSSSLTDEQQNYEDEEEYEEGDSMVGSIITPI
ncbi:750_t:CDS:2 [Ambispora leptoticha]|uniref:750_t:CDS:1 n=1 Tax=Ambispora leptoticha TaxID=144679 RepID=A0A9N9F3X5_9GLOM|nr:750_t:CDS:2 [Ambispora leptoticha]